MIKRLIGLLAAMAVIGVIVMTILRWGEYRSMLSVDPQTAAPAEVMDTPAVLPSQSVPTETLTPDATDIEQSDAQQADSLG